MSEPFKPILIHDNQPAPPVLNSEPNRTPHPDPETAESLFHLHSPHSPATSFSRPVFKFDDDPNSRSRQVLSPYSSMIPISKAVHPDARSGPDLEGRPSRLSVFQSGCLDPAGILAVLLIVLPTNRSPISSPRD